MTIPEQRVGNIYDMLAAWAGECDFATPAADCTAPLPVTWQYFSAHQEGKNVRLNWQTSNETEHDYYVVEWSTDGQHFLPLATVRLPSTPSATVMQYTHIHQQPTNGSNYYRIRQVDLDGAFSFSSIERLTLTNDGEAPSFSLFPNPASEAVQLRFSDNNFAQDVQLLGVTGLPLQTYRVSSTEQSLTIPLSNLPQGIYLLRAGGQTRRVVKR